MRTSFCSGHGAMADADVDPFDAALEGRSAVPEAPALDVPADALPEAPANDEPTASAPDVPADALPALSPEDRAAIVLDALGDSASDAACVASAPGAVVQEGHVATEEINIASANAQAANIDIEMMAQPPSGEQAVERNRVAI